VRERGVDVGRASASYQVSGREADITPEEGSMRYLLLICNEKSDTPPPAAVMESIVKGHMAVSAELRQAGKMVVSERLRPDTEGTRVRAKAGQRQVMDGPFAETKEALGGFYLIECGTKEEAVEWAKKLPLAEGGYIDVRPIWPMG
jgi:hypothetical protein